MYLLNFDVYLLQKPQLRSQRFFRRLTYETVQELLHLSFGGFVKQRARYNEDEQR